MYGKFDSAYAVEATVHSPKLEIVYGQVFNALKPGGLFASYEWVTTSKYDENNPEHRRIIHGIEVIIQFTFSIKHNWNEI